MNFPLRHLGQITILGLFLLAFLLTPRASLAAIRCETIYGGGETCLRTGEIQVNKTVFDPRSGNFVDNLDITAHKFNPGDEVVFQLQVKNVGEASFDSVQVTDILPPSLDLISGSTAFDIANLDPGETETRQLRAQVNNNFPDDKATVCVVDTAEAAANDERDKDAAQLCLEKNVLGAAVLPATGPSDWLLLLSDVALASVASLALKKFVKAQRS